MKDVGDFLRRYPPFDDMSDEDLATVARAVEVEFHASGTVLFEQGDAPLDHLGVVVKGAVRVVHDGRVIDELEPGELFGQGSLLTDLPARFSGVAAGDTLCYRIPAAVARRVLAHPAGMRFVARSLLADPVPRRQDVDPVVDAGHRPVADLLRTELVLCESGESVREVAGRMTRVGATAAVVTARGGQVGIITDRDFRQRVIAEGRSPDVPVAEVMTFPAYTAQADRMSSEVLLDLLEWGVRHVPVVSAQGRVLGVLEDADLLAAAPRSSFHLRAAITRARTVTELVAAATQLRPAVLALHDARVAAVDIAGVHSVVSDALTRRLVELTVAEVGEPPTPFTWMALGSLARREAVPSSDVDSALVWYGAVDAAAQARLQQIAQAVAEGLTACGFPADQNGAVATSPDFARSYAGWQEAAARWLARPDPDAVMLVSLVVDGRPVWGIRSGPALSGLLRDARRRPAFLRLLARYAVGQRPPTGFLRDFVVESSGRHAGRLDLKRVGLLPVVNVGRWAGMTAGVTSASTLARLRAGAEAGTLTAEDTRTLEQAFNLFLQLRLDHQVAQLGDGLLPDDFVRPSALDPLTRAALKEAFREVAAVQRRITTRFGLGVP